jgi:hypothetical protein
LNSGRSSPARSSTEVDEMSFSGAALVEFLRAVLGKGVPFTFRAKGLSMSPFIRDGDVVTVSPLQDAMPRLGDVLAFVGPGGERLVIHRVVGGGCDSYLVRGDATSEVDGLVREGDILGRVTGVERDGQEIRLGLGPERLLIAILTRSGLLSHVVSPACRLLRSITKRTRT